MALGAVDVLYNRLKKSDGNRDKSLITSNLTGETLEVFVLTESPVFRNDIDSIPIDIRLGFEHIAHHLSFLPLEISIEGFLVHSPESNKVGVGSDTYGSTVRPIDLYQVGHRFANQSTTFSYQTPTFPGAFFDDLVLVEFSPRSTNEYPNAYPVTFKFKSVMLVGDDRPRNSTGSVKSPISRGIVEPKSKDLPITAPISVGQIASGQTPAGSPLDLGSTALDINNTISDLSNTASDVSSAVSEGKDFISQLSDTIGAVVEDPAGAIADLAGDAVGEAVSKIASPDLLNF